jgi:hypothetical protein
MSTAATFEDEPQCPRCGSSQEFVPCWSCGGEVFTDHDCGEDTCCCRFPENNVVCDHCRGRGGHYRCLSSKEWCEANPLTKAVGP